MMCENKSQLKEGQIVRVHLSEATTGLAVVNHLTGPIFDENDVSVIFIEKIPNSVIKLGVSYMMSPSDIEILN